MLRVKYESKQQNWVKQGKRKIGKMGHSENRTRDLSHPKRESYH